jgi:dipeptidyl aminopeptidase/acylaminoacyl peptidase
MRNTRRLALRACNRKRAFCRAAPVLLAMALAIPVTYEAVGGERSLTVDDLLKLSDVGRAIVLPGSETFVWEQSPPYDTLGDYGAGSAGTSQGNDYAIFTVGPNTKVPRELFRPHEGTTYLLGDFSRDGHFLTLLAMRDGKVRLAVYDFRRHRLKEFALAPRFPAVQLDPDWAWLDSRRLAVAVYPEGEGPWQLTFRRGIGKHLAESWVKSWKGKEASVDQYDSSASDMIRPLPGRLMVVDMVSGQVQQLASGQFSGLRPSPDGRWLAAVRQSMLPQSTLERPHLDWTYARSTLAVFSLTGVPGPREMAPELDVLPSSIEWNPSSGDFAFFASRDEAGLRNGDFWIVDPVNSTLRVAPHTDLSLTSQRVRGGPQWPERPVWVGDSLAVFARSTPGEPGTLTFEDIKSNGIVDPRVAVASVPAHWFLLTANSAPRDLTPEMQNVSPFPVIADESPFVVLGDGQAWRLDASGPPVRLFPESLQRLAPLAHQNYFSLARSNGGGGIVSVAGGSGTLAQIVLDDESPILRLLTTPPETSVLALSNSGTALLQIGAGKGAQLALMRAGSSPIMLSKLKPSLDPIAETRWAAFDYANAEGSKREQLSGCLLLPPDYQPGYKYPLIVEVYPDRPGGCAAPEARHRYAMGAYPTSYSEHLLAARGFVVFHPDAGGGISRTAEGPQAQLSAIVDRGIDAVIAAGYGDPTRVGLLGISQGGVASLWIATQSQRYKAIVSINGWSDIVTGFFETSWAQELAPTEMPDRGHTDRYLSSVGSSFSMGGTPWQLPQRYIQNSPLWRSDTVSAPVLLIHSDMDQFDDGSYKAFFSSLYIQKKDARLLIYRGEGHSPSSPANIRDMWKNIFSWFDHYLKIQRDPDGRMVLRD